MTLVEFIGFIAALLVLAFSVVRRMMEERRRRQNPEEYRHKHEEEKRKYNEFLRSLNIEGADEDENEEREEGFLPPPPPALPRPRRHDRRHATTTAKAPMVVRKAPRGQHPESHRSISDDFQFHAGLDSRHSTTAIDDRQVGTRVKPKIAQRAELLVNKELRTDRAATVRSMLPRGRIKERIAALPSRRSMVISHEIFGPPGGLYP